MSGIYIKDLDKKSNIDGTESILIQDSNGTKQLDINTLLNNNTSTLTFTSLTDFQNYTPTSSDVGKRVIINKGEYELSNTHYDWSISTSTNGIYLNITNKDEINYAMFGCALDGITDDTQGMLKAHAYSNENKVLLKNTSGTIYKADKTHTHTTSDITNLSIPTKTSELTNDSNFLKSIPYEYNTE